MLRIIATIRNNNSMNIKNQRIVGYRILDDQRGRAIDCSIPNALSLLNSNRNNNVESIKNGKIELSDGVVNSLPILDVRTLNCVKNDVLIVLAEIKQGDKTKGYKVTNYKGRMEDMLVNKFMAFESKGYYNAKVVRRTDKIIISAIKGTIPIINDVTNLRKQISRKKDGTSKVLAPTAVALALNICLYSNKLPDLDGKYTRISEALIAKGAKLFANLPPDRKSIIGRDSQKLHLKSILGLYRENHVRMTNGGLVVSPEKVGVRLVSDVDIVVPEISVLKDKNTGITHEDIKHKKVSAGKDFILTNYEFMFLIIRPEYAGFLSYKDNPKGAYLIPKLKAYGEGKAKLPTPFITIDKTCGSANDILEIINDTNGILGEFKDKFGPLISNKNKRMRIRR